MTLGKHQKRITCGAWSNSGTFGLGSEDRTITLNNAEGDTLQQPILHGEPTDLQFYNPPPGAPADGRLNEAKVRRVRDAKGLQAGMCAGYR